MVTYRRPLANQHVELLDRMSGLWGLRRLTHGDDPFVLVPIMESAKKSLMMSTGAQNIK
jgi:hypothetical protein